MLERQLNLLKKYTKYNQNILNKNPINGFLLGVRFESDSSRIYRYKRPGSL